MAGGTRIRKCVERGKRVGLRERHTTRRAVCWVVRRVRLVGGAGRVVRHWVWDRGMEVGSRGWGVSWVVLWIRVRVLINGPRALGILLSVDRSVIPSLVVINRLIVMALPRRIFVP